MSFGNQQQPGQSQGMSLSPTATDQNGQLQRLLQASPQLNTAAPSPNMGQHPWGQAAMGGVQQYLSQPPAQSGYAPMPIGNDPNVQATMQGLQGLLAASKQKKQDFAKAMMGGG